MMKVLNLDCLSKEDNKLFNEIALQTRVPFNELVQEISKPHINNIHWIVGSIASRNKYNSPLFYRCCQLAFIKEQLEIHGKIDEIILSDRPLATLLKKQLTTVAKITCTETTLERVWRLFRPHRQFLVAIYFFTLRSLSRSKKGREKLKPQTPLILVETFVLNNKPGDGGSIVGGKYIDRYYSGMLECLTEAERKNIFFLPTTVGFWNPIKIFKTIRAAEYQFVLHDDFLKLGDYLSILSHPFKALRLSLGSHNFKGFEMGALLLQENRRNCSDFISILGILNYKFAFRLKENNIKISLLVDWYENQVMDRGMIVGFHDFHPDTHIVGYQGYVISKGLHIYAQPIITELLGRAVPDVVAVTGKGLQDNILEFCDKIKVDVSPGFRFEKVWRERKYFPDPEYFTILVGLPIELDDCKSILEIIINDAELLNRDNMRLYVKPHPTSSPETIKGLFSEGKLDKLEFVIGAFHDTLEISDLVITNASSVALESLAKGTPVIIIAPSTGILQNPIPEEVNNETWAICYTSEDIRHAIGDFTRKTRSGELNFHLIGNEIRDTYFEPVTRKGVLKFLNMAAD